MLVATGLVALITLALPYSPLAGLLGFTPLPVTTLVLMLAIAGVYFVAAELVKRWFYRRFGD